MMMIVKKLVVVFQDRKYFKEVRRSLGKEMARFPTTSFDEQKISMTIEAGLITKRHTIGTGCIVISDCNNGRMIIDAYKIRSLNRTSVLCFELRR
jgi:hypothetical protein